MGNLNCPHNPQYLRSNADWRKWVRGTAQTCNTLSCLSNEKCSKRRKDRVAGMKLKGVGGMVITLVWGECRVSRTGRR